MAKFLFIIFLLASCLKAPKVNKGGEPDDNFNERKRKLSFEKVMKALPNIVDLRDTIDVVVYGKLDESEIKGIKFYLYETPGGRIIYRGSLVGVMNMPKNRIKIPISSNDHIIYGVFFNEYGDKVESVLEKLDSGEVIIRSKHFSVSVLEK